MRKLSQSVGSYLANNGWSSVEFLAHAKFLFVELPKFEIAIEVGRTVVYLRRTTRNGAEVVALKCYVHYQGNSKEYLTITDSQGNALKNFYCDCNPQEILDFIIQKISEQKENDPHDHSRFDLFRSSYE